RVAGGRGAACAPIDYGHVAPHRPTTSPLASSRRGRAYEATFEGAHALTAHVAVASVADRVGATVHPQRDLLRRLGLSGARPPIELAHSDPSGYLRALSRATPGA